MTSKSSISSLPSNARLGSCWRVAGLDNGPRLDSLGRDSLTAVRETDSRSTSNDSEPNGS